MSVFAREKTLLPGISGKKSQETRDLVNSRVGISKAPHLREIGIDCCCCSWKSHARAMVLKELTQAELAILAAGPPAHCPHDERGWKAERNRYDRLVKRQRELAKAAEPPRHSSRLEQKKLFVSDEWLAKEHPTIGRVEAGTPIESPTHVRRRISAISMAAAEPPSNARAHLGG